MKELNGLSRDGGDGNKTEGDEREMGERDEEDKRGDESEGRSRVLGGFMRFGVRRGGEASLGLWERRREQKRKWCVRRVAKRQLRPNFGLSEHPRFEASKLPRLGQSSPLPPP